MYGSMYDSMYDRLCDSMCDSMYDSMYDSMCDSMCGMASLVMHAMTSLVVYAHAIVYAPPSSMLYAIRHPPPALRLWVEE